MTIQVLIPPYLIPQDESSRLVDDGTMVFRPAQAQGLPQRQSFSEPRLRVKQSYKNLTGTERGAMMSALRSAKGKFGTVRALVGYSLRGSFAAPELLSNNTFASGTTVWSATGGTITAYDRVLRWLYNSVTGASFLLQNVSYTQYAPYVLRIFALEGRGSLLTNGSYSINVEGSSAVGAATVRNGLTVCSAVLDGSNANQLLLYVAAQLSGQLTGDYVDILYTSMARCALVDNGLNALLYPDQLDNAAWTKTRCSISANSTTAPDGTSTADKIVEDSSASSTHFITQSGTKAAVAQDWCASGYFKCIVGARDINLYIGVDNTNGSSATFTIQSGAGSVGTVSNGGTATNGRAFIQAVSDSWYYCAIVSHLPSTATVRADAYLVNGGSGVVYSGDGSSNTAAWGFCAYQSSVPSCGAHNTSSATTGSSQTGSALKLKGLQASINGLLLPDDLVEINGELKSVMASLNSDAAGLGYLQFSPALFRSPADNDPVIINKPMGKFILNSDTEWKNNFGVYTDIDLELDAINE